MSWNNKEEIEIQKFLNPVVAGFARVLSALNLLKTKRRMLYLKTHFVPRS